MNKIYEYLIEAEKDKTYQDIFGADNSKLKDRACEEEWQEILSASTLFEQNKQFKMSACKKYNKNISLPEAYWIINDWGGIGSFKKNERNNNKISNFLVKLKKDNFHLTRSEFSTISSLSKISFFHDIEKYCIYDSRVIYSLNWITYKTDEPGVKFFPMPNGRNKIIANFPMEAIIKFSLLGRGETNFSKYYYSHKEAYNKYNELMNNLSIKLFGNTAKPFFTEMLLFGIADKYVHQDMKKEIEIKIKSKA
jgi:hypothetical protein